MKLRFLIQISIVLLVLSGCSSQKKAENKIYRLTEKFPGLVETKDTTFLFVDTISFYQGVVDTFFHIESLLNIQDSIQLKDSTVVLTIYRKDDGLRFQANSLCPDAIVEHKARFQYPVIRAACNCKKEIKSATALLRKQNRRMKFLLAGIIFLAGFIAAFFSLKKISR
jgi:hypothetical protein